MQPSALPLGSGSIMAMWWYPHSLVYRVTNPPSGFFESFTGRLAPLTGHPGEDEDEESAWAVVASTASNSPVPS